MLPHTADVILEAWGPDLATCLTEAGRGLIEGFARPVSAARLERRRLEVQAPDAERLLAAWLNELLFIVDTAGVVPISVEVEAATSTSCSGTYVAVPVTATRQIGAVPKSISLSGLEVSNEVSGCRCQVLVDV